MTITACCWWLAFSLLAAPVLANELTERLAALEDRPQLNLELFRQQLLELKPLLATADEQSHRRWRRQWCWSQPETEVDAAIAFASEQLARAEAAGDQAAAVDFHLCRGWFLQLALRPDEARAAFDHALAQAIAHKLPRAIADARYLRGDLLAYNGEVGSGIIELQQAYQQYHELGLEAWANYSLANLANSYRRMGDYQQALNELNQLVAHYQLADDGGILPSLLLQRGQLLADMGRYQEAFAELNVARQSYARAGDHLGIVLADANIGRALLLMERYPEALEILGRARASYPNPELLEWGLIRLFEGEALLGQGLDGLALQAFADAEKLIRADNNPRLLVILLAGQAKAQAGLKEFAKAYQLSQEQIALEQQLRQWQQNQQLSRMRLEFEQARRKQETAKLLAERDAERERLVNLERISALQYTTLLLSSLLLLVALIWVRRHWWRRD